MFINVLLNQWNNAFYNSLQDKNYGVFVSQLFKFTYLAGAYIVVAVYQLYLNQMLQIRWRRWLTDRYLAAWLKEKAYYRMQLQAAETDNPDQRIAEDLRLFVRDHPRAQPGDHARGGDPRLLRRHPLDPLGLFTIPGVNVHRARLHGLGGAPLRHRGHLADPLDRAAPRDP